MYFGLYLVFCICGMQYGKEDFYIGFFGKMFFCSYMCKFFMFVNSGYCFCKDLENIYQ